jgi:hypothetical protein
MDYHECRCRQGCVCVVQRMEPAVIPSHFRLGESMKVVQVPPFGTSFGG